MPNTNSPFLERLAQIYSADTLKLLDGGNLKTIEKLHNNTKPYLDNTKPRVEKVISTSPTVESKDLPKVFKPGSKIYKVKPNDSLWSIAHSNNIPLEVLLKHNNFSADRIIHPGDYIQIATPVEKKTPEVTRVNYFDEASRLKNLSDREKIIRAKQTSPYIILSKVGDFAGTPHAARGHLEVFSPNDASLFSTNRIQLGSADFNTVVPMNGKKPLYGTGNFATPAGISRIKPNSKNWYEGDFAWARQRLNWDGKNWSDINSSFHYYPDCTETPNGCVRFLDKGLTSKVIGKTKLKDNEDTLVYTVPSDGKSRFNLSPLGNLSYSAENPFGVTDKSNPKVYFDDYNITAGLGENPDYYMELRLSDPSFNDTRNGINFGDPDVRAVINRSIKHINNSANENASKMGISRELYHRLGHIALGIIGQESQYFGTNSRWLTGGKYPLKKWDNNGKWRATAKFTKPEYISLGAGQIKERYLTQRGKELMRKLGVNNKNIWEVDGGINSTIVKLYDIYRNELHGGNTINEEKLQKVIKRYNKDSRYEPSVRNFMGAFNLDLIKQDINDSSYIEHKGTLYKK